MRTFGRLILFSTATAVLGFAQQWEVGGMAGVGLPSSVSVNGPADSARAGFQAGAAFNGYVGNNLYKHLGGELHYGFLQNNLKLSSAGETESFSGVAHVLHYDLTYHTNRSESKVEWFAALGGGMKVFQGTGAQQAYQPLSQFGYLTQTREINPMVSVGGGFKWKLTGRAF